MYVGLLGGLHHLVHADLARVVAVGNVVADAAVEENGFLGDDSQARADERNVERLDVLLLQGLRR